MYIDDRERKNVHEFPAPVTDKMQSIKEDLPS